MQKVIIDKDRQINQISIGLTACVLALKLEGKSCTNIAAQMGCKELDVKRILKEWDSQLSGLEAFKIKRADIFDLMIMRFLDKIDEFKLEASDLRDLIAGVQKLDNQAKLSRGESTSIVSYKDLEVKKQEIIKAIEEAEKSNVVKFKR